MGHAFGLVSILRIAQATFALVVLGLSGYVANWYNVDTVTSSPSQINFLIFASLWSMISIAYLEVVPRFAARGKQCSMKQILEGEEDTHGEDRCSLRKKEEGP